MSDWTVDTTTKVVLPNTCTFDSWKNSGTCGLEWTGLESLLNLGITLRATMRDCGAFQMPEFKLECVGADCEHFLRPTICATQSECGAEQVCTDLYSNFYNLTDPLGQRDWIQSFFKLTTGAPDECGTEANGRNFVNNALRFINSLAPDTGSKTSICIIDFESRFSSENFNLTTWANAQATVDGDVVALHTLRAYTPPGPPVVAPTTSSVTFNVLSTVSTVDIATIVNALHPGATITTTNNGGVTTVVVTFATNTNTGTQATASAQTFGSDLQNPNSPLAKEFVSRSMEVDNASLQVGSAVDPIITTTTTTTTTTGIFPPPCTTDCDSSSSSALVLSLALSVVALVVALI